MTKTADLADFRLVQHGFTFRGDQYSFDDIAHLRFARLNVTTYMVPVKLGTEGSAALLIELSTGDTIKFVAKPGWVFTSDQTKLNSIVDLYSYLAHASFKARLGTYLAAVEERGYFVYSGYRFYPTRKVIALEDREFTADNTQFMRTYNQIELRPKNYGVFHKLKRELSWSSNITSVDILTDTDVIMTILDHFYGLRWS